MSNSVTLRPLKETVVEYLRRHRLEKKFRKALELLSQDIRFASTENTGRYLFDKEM